MHVNKYQGMAFTAEPITNGLNHIVFIERLITQLALSTSYRKSQGKYPKPRILIVYTNQDER